MKRRMGWVSAGLWGGAILAVLAAGCGCPEVAAPDAEASSAAPARVAAADEEDEDTESSTEDEDSEEERDSSSGAASAPAPEPRQEDPPFTDGMGVEEARAVIPSDVDYVHLDEQHLAEPLMDMGAYSPCNLKGHQHFKVRVAIWDGRAVGVDVTSSDKKLAACVDRVIRGLEWRERARSLNTVEYAY